ncbi:MAG: glycoside hydrolase family 3 protein, partial [Bacteroidetes bacterium]|nr:glycoside hydrolase family 3 protein [Bacteroidota bacterium]
MNFVFRTIITGCSFLLFYTISAQSILDEQVEKRLKTLTLEEKVGQMSQIDLSVLAVGKICEVADPIRLDTAKLRLAFRRYKVGSVLNCGCGFHALSRKRWLELIDSIQEANTRYTAHGIPVLYGIDAIHGANYTLGSTLFPQQIGQAATWNPDLVKAAAQITAYETRASGIPWNFSPVLDIGRQPLWSRFFETYGEDVCLAKKMTNACITGYQGNNFGNEQVAACMKHFLGYSYPLSGKDRTPVWIGERELRAYFLPTFQEAILLKAKTLMINSGELNGVPVHASYPILTTLLRNELGFEGVAVTDWEDVYKLHTTHKVAETLR